ncbi:MAG: 50S ribosomal protein L19 [Planctomycetes bacterium]|nr:50S ribosomal protein L19 [Planctomycetota bacterium]
MNRLDEFEKTYHRKKQLAFDIGDTVDVHVKITEGDKERIQIFSGTVIKKRGGGLRETFTVRRIVQGEGVERIFPRHSPKVVDLIIKKKGKVRRAKLYYLRDRVGKATKVKEKVWERPGLEGSPAEAVAAKATPAAAPVAAAAPAAAAAAPKKG